MSVFLENSPIWIQVEHKVDGNSGTASICYLQQSTDFNIRTFDCWSVRRAWQLDCKRFITNRGDIISAGLSGSTAKLGEQTNNQTNYELGLNYSALTQMAQRLDREITDRKVRGSNATSVSRLPLTRLGQPGSIPALVLPPGGMAIRHQKGATSERLIDCLNQNNHQRCTRYINAQNRVKNTCSALHIYSVCGDNFLEVLTPSECAIGNRHPANTG
ncbi:hypothetical protein CSKR_102937 [Clonorchis sinensis]|uniref:Uncharacterized protein n=1 Tax=Clonorchis sinensis TaxID=79923 RepID=A0A3R7CCL5_CLOSI|nr:hypothetical protein CSKR_102937 [Clonorchis sinensis]